MPAGCPLSRPDVVRAGEEAERGVARWPGSAYTACSVVSGCRQALSLLPPPSRPCDGRVTGAVRVRARPEPRSPSPGARPLGSRVVPCPRLPAVGTRYSGDALRGKPSEARGSASRAGSEESASEPLPMWRRSHTRIHTSWDCAVANHSISRATNRQDNQPARQSSF